MCNVMGVAWSKESKKTKEIVQKGNDAFSVFQWTASTSTCITLRAKSLVSQDAVLFHLLVFASSPEPVALPKPLVPLESMGLRAGARQTGFNLCYGVSQPRSIVNKLGPRPFGPGGYKSGE